MLPSSHILCVDDDRDTCDLVETMLAVENKQFNLTTETNPEKAVEIIKQRSFDLYIFDYAMPNITGIDLCHLVRKIDHKTPIIFFTAMARLTDKEEAFKAGASEVLVKPDDLDRFVKTTFQLLNMNFLRK